MSTKILHFVKAFNQPKKESAKAFLEVSQKLKFKI